MLATMHVTLEKNKDQKEIVINKVFTYQYNLAKAWTNPRWYRNPIQTNFHQAGRYRTQRACAQIENRCCTSRYMSGLQKPENSYRPRDHS